MVQELKTHPEVYEGFVIETSIIEEADKFLDPGYFFEEIGNCMPFALSNALGMPIFLLSTLPSQPIIALNPTKVRLFFPLLVAFNHHGCGHYDAIDYGPDITSKFICSSETQKTGTRGCTCGRSYKSNSLHCVPKKTKYTEIVRFPCLSNEKPCTRGCSCKNCNNSFGQKETQVSRERKRKKHKWQVSIRPSVQYGMFLGEKIKLEVE